MSANKRTSSAELVLKAKNELSKPTKAAQADLESLRKKSEDVKKSFSSIGGALASAAGVFGIASLTSHVIEANEELDRLRNKITGIEFAYGGAGLSAAEKRNEAIARGVQLEADLESMSLRTIVPADALVEAYANLRGPLSAANLSIKDTLGFTEQIAKASRAFGGDAAAMGTELGKMLIAGNIEGESLFALSLRQHATEKKIEFSKLSQVERVKLIRSELAKVAPIADEMRDTWESQAFILKSRIGDYLRDVGRPVMDALLDKIKGMVAGWEKNEQAITNGMIRAGKGALEVVTTIGKTVMIIAENWKVFAASVALFKAPAAFASMAENVKLLTSIPAALRGIGSAAEGVNTIGGRFARLGGKLGAILPKLGMATAAVGAFGIAVNEIAQWIESEQIKRREAPGFQEAMQALETNKIGRLVRMTEKMGFQDRGGKIDVGKMTNLFAAAPGGIPELKKIAADTAASRFWQEARAAEEKRIGGSGALADMSQEGREQFSRRVFAGQLARALAERLTLARETQAMMRTAQQQDQEAKVPPPPKVVIDKVEVKMDFRDADPDNVVLGFGKALEELARNPRQSLSFAGAEGGSGI